MDLLLDTTVLIDFLQGDLAASEILQRGLDGEDVLFVSAISVIELFQKPNLTPDEQARRQVLVEGFDVLPLTSDIAIQGSLRASDVRNAAPDGIVFDALIAETARSNRLQVVSRNVADFRILGVEPQPY